MKKIAIYFGIIILFSLTACEPEPIPIDLPQAEQKLVVYTQTLPDQLLVVSLSKSFSALLVPDDNFDTNGVQSSNAFLDQFLVNNARVVVRGPDYNDTLLWATNGVYLAPFFPFTPGNTYELNAYDTITGLSVSSFTTTLPIVEFDSVSATRKNGSEGSEIEVFFSVNDPPGDNYYLVNVYTDSIPTDDFFTSSNSSLNSFSFSDKEFPNGKVNRKVSIFTFGSNSDTIPLTLTNISRDYFDYLQSRNRSDASFLSEPVSFPSNVTNGYGYFNLHFPSVRFAEVK